MSTLTPVMQQYYRIKKENRDSILFFRMGDFYEMFDQDAREVSSLLNITLTRRNNVPMCGIPYHASHGYIGRLLKAGKKIAVCEQISLPKGGRGIADRQVVEIITPGTVMEEDFLEKTRNNYLTAMGACRGHLCFASIDLSTTEFSVAAHPVDRNDPAAAPAILRKELLRLSPREIIVQESLFEDDQLSRVFSELGQVMINRFPDWSFDMKTSAGHLKKQLGVSNLKGFGLDDDHPAVFSAGVLLEYLEDTAKNVLPHIKNLTLHDDSRYMGLDESSLRNLEILTNLQTGNQKYSLLEILDGTRTSMGARKLRNWLLHPLMDRDEINGRLDRLEYLYRNQDLLNKVEDSLKTFLDLERLASRLAMDKAHARDLISIKNTLLGIASLEAELEARGALDLLWRRSPQRAARLSELAELLERTICEEPALLFTEGNLLKEGYDSKLDELRNLKRDSQKILKDYLEQEKEASGIQSLKIRYNKIIGYFLEVTKSHLSLVPENFIRRQSLVGAERFTTNRLVELETNLNSALERALDLEKEIFLKIRDQVKGYAPELLEAADDVAVLDVIAGLAVTATRWGYVRPVLTDSRRLVIREGRHPVVEAHLPAGEFVANSLETDPEDCSFALITGPNMAGKSTFLRQTALIVLMAQVGSFVPAAEAEIGCVDRIFCRVGASDNLARGESTFLVEMNETAYILRTATRDSLVIMDEVGRGTGTNDGLAIAWAVSEYLIHKIRAKTLFATHYHELTAIRDPRVRNLSLEVLEREGDIIFLKKIKDGPAGNSYGIHVAGLAGLPSAVIARARQLLAEIEGKERPPAGPVPKAPPQGDLFSREEIFLNELLSLDLDSTSPMDALTILYRWKDELI